MTVLLILAAWTFVPVVLCYGAGRIPGFTVETDETIDLFAEPDGCTLNHDESTPIFDELKSEFDWSEWHREMGWAEG